MTIEVLQTSNTNTFQYLVDRVNQLANAMTVSTVTTESNGAVGSANITGTFIANVLIANTVRVSNPTSNIVISVPNTAIIASGDYYLNANGTWTKILTPITEGTYNVSGSGQQEVDNYSTSDYNSVEYYLHLKNNSANGYQSCKILTLHNGNTAAVPNAYSTEYAIISSNGVLGAFTATSNGSHVRLLITPTSPFTSMNVTFSRVNF